MHNALKAHHKQMSDARIALNVNKVALAMKYGRQYSKDALTPGEKKLHYMLAIRHLDLCATYDNHREKVESMAVRGLI